MKKEISPWIVVAAILLTLVVVQVVYWRGLMGGPGGQRLPMRGGGGGHGAETAAPVGKPGVTVTTLAGGRQPGYRDGPGPEALFRGPAGLVVSADGTVYLADSRNHCIRKLSPTGVVSTLAGAPAEDAVGGFADGVGAEARFSSPAGVALAPDGSLLVSDTGNHRLRRVTPSGRVSTFAGADTERDDLGRPVGGYRDGSAAEARFRYPAGLAVDEAGTVYVADAGNGRVRRISPAGEVTTLATVGGQALQAPTELVLAAGGKLWVADTAGGGLWVGPREGPLQRWQPEPGEKGPKAPAGLAARDQAIYVADAGDHCLLRIVGDRLSLVAGEREAASTGYADGYGNLARFSSPAGLALGPGGDVYVADYGNNCLRRVRIDRRYQEGR
jgi:DNA-binding beta-propeller fold protein YncE